MANQFSTNPYSHYHAVNTKEYMSLRNSAIHNFKPDKTYKLCPESAVDFAAAISKNGAQYGYNGMMARVPTTCTIDAADPNNITYADHMDMINTFGVVTMDTIQKNATQLWGAKDWTITVAPKTLIPPSQARGETTAAGSALNADGRALMLARFHSESMGAQAYALLDEDGRKMIDVDRHLFEWYNNTTGELVQDGRTILALILAKLRPNVVVSVFKEISQMQKIIPEKFKYNITEWDCAMEQGRIKIELKCAGQYSDQAYINDYLSQALMTPCKSFNAEVSSLKTKWQLGSDSTLNKQKIWNIITQMYLNFDDDDTWAREISESSQIIALCTKVSTLEAKLEQTIALATEAKVSPTASTNGGTRNKNGPYTVHPERLIKGGPTKTFNGTVMYWCTGDHWSGGKCHNGMYVTHEPGKHDEWRKAQDERNAKRKARRNAAQTPSGGDGDKSGTPADAAAKKLALSEKLRTALSTHAGLSGEAFSRIWEESCRDSGNA